ncbi:ABC transporter substrate-binding protein [Qingshengfaniella alkalisoli]|uniref:Carbohydrate ABC transporter substrate-binding protein n=1 Tax=Qingshengfaniella alkalisoli TaxID=2599296 RepID=A0A5B8IA11_9RHOB|nr:ABC transporter substrate-binding protein [Qingshengfaniella alkalisoli]QDY70869.1 carbohydrate ABC transporter substrate-binding protein [Qingshengfaniella alkalisoli]
MKYSMTALATLFALGLTQGAQAADLRMSWWGGDSRHTATQEALKICGEKHGHTISPEFTGFSGHLEKLSTQLAGGTEADIMQVNWPWLPIFSINGDGFADLAELSDTIDLSNWTEGQLAAATMNGKLNGLPVSTTGRVFMFNKTSFDKAGVELPTNWEELIAASPAFKENLGEDYYPYDASTLNAVLTVSLIATQQTGKDLIDPASNTVAWTADELASAIDFYQNLVDQGVIRSWKDAASEGNVALHENPRWANGEIGGSYEWDSTYFKYSDPMDEGQELVPVKLLQVEGAVTEGVYRKPSMVFAVSRNSDDPQAAAQIVNCLMNEPEGVSALGDTRGLPASKAAATQLSEAGAIDPVLIEANSIIMDGTGPTVSPFNEHPEVRAAFQDTLELFAYGEVSSEEAAQEIIDGVNDALEDFSS